MDKFQLRSQAKNIRKNLDIEKVSFEICKKIKNFELYKSAKNVMIYYPTKYEINLLNLLEDDKNFYLPKVNNEDILVCPYCDNLIKSKFNILEPCTNPINAENLDLIIVPALMVDKKNFRLGYGGGFYDRFLAKYSIPTITPIEKELIIRELPHENYDIRIDYVIAV